VTKHGPVEGDVAVGDDVPRDVIAPFAIGVPRIGVPTVVSLSLLEPVAATALAVLLAHQVPAIAQLVRIATTLISSRWLAALLSTEKRS
jgi:hypothetical protein